MLRLGIVSRSKQTKKETLDFQRCMLIDLLEYSISLLRTLSAFSEIYLGQEKQIPKILAVTPFSHPFHLELHYDTNGVLLCFFFFVLCLLFFFPSAINDT